MILSQILGASKQALEQAFEYLYLCRAREQAGVGNAEKQKIIMQISAVQTDIKRNIEERSELFLVCFNMYQRSYFVVERSS